jgi:hypothetical protein
VVVTPYVKNRGSGPDLTGFHESRRYPTLEKFVFSRHPFVTPDVATDDQPGSLPRVNVMKHTASQTSPAVSVPADEQGEWLG